MALKTVEMKYSQTGNVIMPRTSLTNLASSSNTLGVCPGQWLVASTALPVASAGAAADLVVDTIYDYQGRPYDFQYRTVAELDATGSGTEDKVRTYGAGKIVFEMLEDADGGAMAAAVEAGAYYADITNAEPTGSGNKSIIPIGGGAIPTIYIDSSGANASSTGLLIEILGLSPRESRVYGASTARRWYVKIIDACAAYSQ